MEVTYCAFCGQKQKKIIDGHNSKPHTMWVSIWESLEQWPWHLRKLDSCEGQMEEVATPQNWTVSKDILMAFCDECKFAWPKDLVYEGYADLHSSTS